MLFQKNIVKKYLSLLNEEQMLEAWKRILCFSLFLLLSVTIMAQTQQGVAYRYNGRNARTPLGNVTISYDANKRSTISAENGTFALTLTGKQMGDRIGQVTVKKREMMVFNQQAVDEWSVRKEPLMLILCNTDEFEKQKENLIAIGRREAKKKYDKQKAELEAKLNASQIKEAEYEAALDRAYEELETLQKNMDKYVDAFVRIDLSEVSAEEQRILDMVHEGRIDEAVEAYEKLDISGKLRQARENKKALSEAKSKIEEEETRQDQVIEELIAKQEREIATLKLAGGKDNYDKIGIMLKENALADTTDVNVVLKYAIFAHNQKDYMEALKFYIICLNNCTPDRKSEYNHAVGSIYFFMGDIEKAKKYFMSTLQTAHLNSQKRLKLEAAALRDIGSLYYQDKSLESLFSDTHGKAMEYWGKSMNLFQMIYDENPNAENRDDLANMQMKLGMVLASIRKPDFKKAEEYYFSALDHYKALSVLQPEHYRKSLADMYDRLGAYYVYLSNNDDYLSSSDSIRQNREDILNNAERYYIDAYNIYLALFNQDNDSYRATIAYAQRKMARFYKNDLEQLEKARPYLFKSMENYTILYNKNPHTYCISLSGVHDDWGVLYTNTHDYSKAEEHYLASLQYYSLHYHRNPCVKSVYDNMCNKLDRLIWFYSKYIVDDEKCEMYHREYLKVAEDCYNLDDFYVTYAIKRLGKFYIKRARFNEARTLFEHACELDNANSVNVFFYDCYGDLGEESTETKDYKKAEEYYLKSLEYAKILFIQDSVAYRSRLASIQKDLADVYYDAKDYIKAEEFYLQALENYQVLFNTHKDILRSRLVHIQYCLMYIYSQDKEKLDLYDAMLDTVLSNCEVLYQDNSGYESMIVNLRNRKGLRCLIMNKIDEAISLFESTYKIEPEKSISYLASGYNAKAYEYAKAKDFEHAIETIDKAISLKPEEANYYDSKGEILLMKGDEQGALDMWQKVMELDPDFLSKYGGKTPLYEQLKERGFIQ